MHDWRRERGAQWLWMPDPRDVSPRHDLLLQPVQPVNGFLAYGAKSLLAVGCGWCGSQVDAALVGRFESEWTATDADSVNARHQGADALLHALFAYDLSVRSLVWEQAKYQPQAMAAWVLAETRRAGVEHSGRWFNQSEFPTSSDAEEENGIMRAYRYFDGEDRMFGFDLTVRRGKVAPPDRDMLTTFSPFHLLGRYVDFSQGRTIPELLADSEHLHTIDPDPDQPWPGLCGDVRLLEVTFTLTVRVDPAHGYAPRTILLVRKDFGAPLESLETTRYKQFDGIWVPTAGVRGLWTLLSKRDRQDGYARAVEWARLASDLESLNGVGGMNEKTRTATLQSVRRACATGSCTGEPDLFYHPMGGSEQSGPFTPEVLVATIVSCNGAATEWLQTPVERWSALPAPPTAWMFDLFRGRQAELSSALEPIRFEDAPMEKAELP